MHFASQLDINKYPGRVRSLKEVHIYILTRFLLVSLMASSQEAYRKEEADGFLTFPLNSFIILTILGYELRISYIYGLLRPLWLMYDIF